ncbi:restriction endonuclease [Ochrobactrum sp. MYb379]|uniref:restriction endonuclease n=1 Tax=Ochrobactrum sp. MYb379 TaxID=2745275 RepID=UPI0030ADF5FE
MHRHVHADYAPTRSWEQFEELCANIFQSAWRDPALVRHGRVGQRQSGVDIVARNGALYPIGLQCKKRKRWPVSRITTAQIDTEVAGALALSPALKAFYILTTAPDGLALI